jgi:PAS domain S-box-containing protein
MDTQRAEGRTSWQRVLLFAVVYYVSGRLGLVFTSPPDLVSPVWPPAAVSFLGALFLGGWSFLIIWATVFVFGTVWTAALQGDPVMAMVVAAISSVGAAARAWLGAWLVRRFAPGTPSLLRVRFVAALVFFAGIVASTVSATVGVAARRVGGLAESNLGLRWLTWWLADVAGVVIVAPALLALRERIRLPRSWAGRVELGLLSVVAAIVALTVFGGGLSEGLARPLSALLLPLVVWAAFRFGAVTTSWLVACVAPVAIWGAARGVGPFAAETEVGKLLLVQSFLIVLAATALTLASIMQERWDALRQLQETTTLLRSVTEGTTDVVFVKDTSGRYLMINTAGAAYVGKKVEEVLGRTDEDIFAPDMARFIREYDRRILEDGETRTDEYAEMKDGVRRTYLATKGPCRDALGQITGVFGISRDVTEHKLEATLLKGILEGTNDVFSALDRDFRFVAFNDALRRAYRDGFGVDLAMGARLSEVLADHPEALAQRLRVLGEALRGEQTQTTWSIESPGPEARFYDVRASPLRDETGHVIGGALIGRDITQTLEKEGALRGSEARFRALSLQAPVGIFVTDAGGRCTFVNTRWCELSGLRPEEAIGQAWSHAVHLDDLVRVAFAWDAAIERGQEFRAEYRLQRPDGQVIWVSGSAAPVVDTLGRTEGWLGTVVDVTERRRHEEELRQNRDAIGALSQDLAKRAAALQSANRELESFSYSVSHDLRTPLRAIDGFTRALEEDYGPGLDQQARHYIERVRRATRRMGQIIDDLLELSRVARGDLRLETVDLTALALEVDAGLRSAHAERDVRFTAAPGLLARGDPSLLRLVLENLLGNAWKYTSRQAHARIEFGCRSDGAEPAYFVRDNGAGFDMAYADKLFGAFQRLHDPSEFPGSGIGLATVARIVARHGGRVFAEGAEGRGACFYFTLEKGAPP